jgi:hypothetical protein
LVFVARDCEDLPQGGVFCDVELKEPQGCGPGASAARLRQEQVVAQEGFAARIVDVVEEKLTDEGLLTPNAEIEHIVTHRGFA